MKTKLNIIAITFLVVAIFFASQKSFNYFDALTALVFCSISVTIFIYRVLTEN